MYIMLLGPPGAGKGTIAGDMVKKHGYVQISTGDLLREHRRNKTDLGRKAQEYMDSGALVPDDLILDMFDKEMTDEVLKKGFILDGFPRTITQADALGELLKSKGIQLSVVALIEVDHEELIKRMLNRRTCPKCQAVYSISYKPPKTEGVCDKCGSKLVIREDQKEDVIRNRLEVYKKQTAPLIEYYTKLGKLKSYSHKDSFILSDMIINDSKASVKA